MKIAVRNIDSFIKSPPGHTQAILVYGPDEGLVRERIKLLTQNIVPDVNDPFNVVDLSGSALAENPAIVLDEAQAISMMGGRRVLRIRTAAEKAVMALKNALPDLKDGDNLILVEAGNLGPRAALRLLFENADNAAAVPCYVEDQRNISRVIFSQLREEGYQASPDALSYIAENVVGDRAVARGEVEKLITYMGPANKNISLDDAIAVIGDGAGMKLDDLTRFVAAGRFAEADRILTVLFSEGTAAVMTLRILQNYFLRLHISKARMQNGETADAAINKLRPPIFFKYKDDFMNQLRNLSLIHLEQALTIITSAEARCKQTGSMPEIITSRAILALSQLCGRAAARRRA